MTAYLVAYGADPKDRLTCRAFPTREAALTASTNAKIVPGVPEGSHAGGCAYVIENEKDVTLSGSLLVDVYNVMTNGSLKKFSDRETGVKRLMAVLPTYAVADQSTSTENEKMQTNTTGATGDAGNVSDMKAPKVRGRTRPLHDDQRITILVEGNPKRAGKTSWTRYQAVLDLPEPRTVGAAIAAGATLGDLRFDHDHGYIRIEPLTSGNGVDAAAA